MKTLSVAAMVSLAFVSCHLKEEINLGGGYRIRESEAGIAILVNNDFPIINEPVFEVGRAEDYIVAYAHYLNGETMRVDSGIVHGYLIKTSQNAQHALPQEVIVAQTSSLAEMDSIMDAMGINHPIMSHVDL